MLSWIVKCEDINGRKLVNYDVLKYPEEIKKIKKKAKSKEEFADKLKTEMMSRYWARCEWEVIIEKRDGRIYITPWISSHNYMWEVDVTDDTSFDWAGFADLHIGKYKGKDEAKIDVYDQLKYRWDEFVDYIWNTRFPYERKKNV